jgi:TolA-binding protein
MLENLPPSSIIAIAIVMTSTILLGYFSWKTLVTSDSFQKGTDLYQQKDYQGAEAAFRKVVSINSTNDVVRLLLGDVLLRQDKVEEAKEFYQEVINRSPKNPDAYLRLSNILMQQEQQDKAIANLEQARDLFQKQRQPEKALQINQILGKINSK